MQSSPPHQTPLYLKRLLLGIVGWGFEPSVAQPPLPLQEFLPLQPLSLDLHPPLPLQEFWPLQACFSFTLLSDWSDWDTECMPERRLDA